jgi:hypothetical protein
LEAGKEEEMNRILIAALAALLIASPAMALDQQEFFLQLENDAIDHYNRAVIAARKAAADGNLDLTMAYLKAADGYRAEAERAAELYGLTLPRRGQ